MESESNPLIALWAHPRSMSTAFERIMRERGDCLCMHEPFMYYYYVERGVRAMPHFEIEADRPTGFSEIESMLLDKALHQPVFIKDMAYYVMPEITRHPALAGQMRHLFLVREPRRSIMSYYKLDPKALLEEIGYQAQWQLYQWLRDNTGQTPMVVKAEDVQADPNAIVSMAWQFMELDYRGDAFEWEGGKTPDDWQQVSGWHQSAVNNSSIQKDPRTEQQVITEFKTLCRSAPHLTTYLDHHLPYYEALTRCASSFSAT